LALRDKLGGGKASVVGASGSKVSFGSPQVPLVWLILFVLVVVLVLSAASFRGIDAGHKGVVLNGPGGPSADEIGEGWHFSLSYPFSRIQVVRYNTQTRDMADETGLTVRSSDNLNIHMDVSLVYHLPPDKVADIVLQYGDYTEIVDRYMRSVPRNVASNFTGEYIGGIGRVIVEDEMRRQITSELAPYQVIVEDFLVRAVDLPDTVDTAIEKKLAAEQAVVTAELERQSIVIKAMAEADRLALEAEGMRNATIIRANGTAEAIRLTIEQLRLSDPTLTNATWAYLTQLYIQALTDPDSNVSFVIVGEGVPIIIQPP
jgi:regulator of protease activity HflC (stomatin/prohibitin superfamily)